MHKDKIQFIKEKGICFGCLVQGHMSKTCNKRQICKVCSQKHPTVLHIEKVENPTTIGVPHPNHDKPSISSHACGHIGAGEEESVLSIVPVKIKASKGNKIVQTYAFLDPGSSATFCTTGLMNQLNMTGKKTNILLRTMNQEKTMVSNVVSGLEVSALFENNFIALPDVYTQTSMPVNKHNIPIQSEVSKWLYLKGVLLPTIEADIGLLIGTNASKLLEPWEIINSQGDGPYAVRTLLGWVVNGPLRGGDNRCTTVNVNRISLVNLHDLMIAQYNTEFNEKAYDEKREMSREDKQFMKIVDESAKIVDGHYSLKLPFKNQDVSLPNNRQIAEQRLDSLKRKFKRDPVFHEEYNNFLSEVLNKGFAERVPREQLQGKEGNIWYIPHHGVYHLKKKKLRVVFDCGASFRGTSLNSELLQGPDFTNGLTGVLIKFRQDSIGIMGDVEAMFHQVKVAEEHVDFLRFLWWPGGDVSLTPLDFRMTVHIFGAVSSSSCASYALRRTAEDSRQHFRSKVIDTILSNFYVDDSLMSVSTEEEAALLIQEVTAACERGGFHLAKWVTNSRLALSSIPESDRAKEVGKLDLDRDKLPTERALGVQWCVEDDNFTFDVTNKPQPHTRRGILSAMSSIYDPLGFLAPLIVPAKLLLQELCRRNVGWDEEIPQSLSDKWIVWKEELKQITNFQVSRCIKPKRFNNYAHAQLHHFADASELAYGSVSYLRLVNERNAVHVSFLMGKSRVAPLKKIIPRLELAAAVLATKVDKVLKSELQLDLETSIFWTDSESVLKYISNEHTRFHTFVANRVSFIRETTEPTQWKFVDTKLNPADEASRGQRTKRFLQNTRWIHGPDFLWKTNLDWPPIRIKAHSLSEDDPEVKRSSTMNVIIQGSTNPTDKLMSYFSSWTKLKVSVAWYLKLKETLKCLVLNRKELSSKTNTNLVTLNMEKAFKQNMERSKALLGGQKVNVSDLKMAELSIIQYVQASHYSEEISSVHTNIKK